MAKDGSRSDEAKGIAKEVAKEAAKEIRKIVEGAVEKAVERYDYGHPTQGAKKDDPTKTNNPGTGKKSRD